MLYEPDQHLKTLARRSLLIACALLGEADPNHVCATRKAKKDLVVRKVWLHVLGLLSSDHDPRTDWVLVGDAYDPMRHQSPKTIMTQVSIAKVTGLDRGTIAKDQADVARWRVQNPEVDRACIAISEAMADLWYAIGACDGWLEELLYELQDDYETARASRKPQAKKPPKREKPSLLDLARPSPATYGRSR
jgi:hypothetical protein